jgi:hypothetical protein
VTERKVCSKHLLGVWEAIFKYDEKGRKKGEEGEESDGKKDVQYAFIRIMQGDTCKGEGREK